MSSTRCVVHFVVYGEWVVLWVAVAGKGGGRGKGEGRRKRGEGQKVEVCVLLV